MLSHDINYRLKLKQSLLKASQLKKACKSLEKLSSLKLDENLEAF